MDLEKIRAYGARQNKKAWLTNPIRAILWRFIAPYFDGFYQEISADIDQQISRGIEAGIQKWIVENSAAQTAGLRKDIMANNHRLASLEQAIAEKERFWADLDEKLGNISTQAKE